MDYYKIGQRIRKYRKAYGYSQDTLAEKVQISTTHLSHIETGNTKLSLQVLVDIARELNVQTDELIYDLDGRSDDYTKNEILDILDACTPQELHIILEVVDSLKSSLMKYK